MPDALLYVLLALLIPAGGWLLMWVGGMKEHKSTVTSFMTEIREDIKKLLKWVAPPIATGSPRQLTEYGDLISGALDAEAWAVLEAARLRDEVEGLQPYEIEERSFAHTEQMDLPSDIKAAKYEHGFPDEHVRQVLGLVLRDRLIEMQV